MASTYLQRTPVSSGSQRTYTISFWYKRATSLGTDIIFSSGASGQFNHAIYIASTYMIILMYDDAGSSTVGQLNTNRFFRDPNGFYHIVVAVDTTDATSSNRIKLYVNGVQETSFTTETYPSQNADIGINTSSYTLRWNADVAGSASGGGVLAHAHFIDGTAYAASDFGETDSLTGIWKPKTAPSVTYGTNGFFLKFENSGAFGTDSSGNGNTFTVNGTMTQTIDTPSNVFCTQNPLANSGSATLANGNTQILASGTVNHQGSTGTLGFNQGKYYWEGKSIATDAGSFYVFPGITCTPNLNDVSKDNSQQAAYRTETQGHTYLINGASGNGYYYNRTTQSYTSTPLSAGSIFSIALDADNGYMYYGVNGTWQNSGDPTSGATGTGGISLISPDATVGSYKGSGYWTPCISVYYTATEVAYNFGNGYFKTTAVSSAQNPDDGIGIFEYDVPTGYRALCTKSINAEEYS